MYISPLEHIVAAVTPLECAICKIEKFMLCGVCTGHVIATLDSRCYLCNKLTSQHRVCKSCSSKSSLRRVWWLGVYDTPIFRTLIYQMKYQRRRAFAREFGNLLAESLPFISEKTLIVPVPTASKRIRLRGYDQAVLIAEQFAMARQLKLVKALMRTNQVDQIGRKRAERFKQMAGSFQVNAPNIIKGAHILLIDDVLTTGATLETAAKLLRKSGARHVEAAVIARHLKS